MSATSESEGGTSRRTRREGTTSSGGQQQDETTEGTHFDHAGNVLEEEEYYCYGCGRRYSFVMLCTGWPDRPHPPIQVISTDELKQDPSNHTAAPNSGEGI